MGRHKKTIASVPDSARDDWMRQVGRQGGGIFLRIHARSPGLKGRFPIVAMNQAMADIDDLEEHCYESWGEDKEFKIFPLDASEQPAKDAAGIELPPLVIRPRRAPLTAAATPAVVASPDPILADEQKRLQADRSRLEIDRERIRIEAERKELDKVKAGGGVVPPDANWPFGPGIKFWVDDQGYAHRLDEEGGPFTRRQNEPKKDPMELYMMMMIEQGKEARAAADRQMNLMMTLLTREDPIIKILPLIVGGQMKLPELMAMLDTMTKGQQAAMKSALENNGEIMKMVAEHALDSGAPDDMISNIQRIGQAATDITGKLVKQATGRESLLSPDKPAQKALTDAPAKPQPVQARKPTRPNPPIDAGQPLPPPPPQGAIAPPPSPAEEAKAEGARRCARLLELHEREMRVESDPAIFFEDEADAKRIVEYVMGLPKSARVAIEKADTNAIYEAFKEFVPADVDRLFTLMNDPVKGKEYTEWAQQFWDEVAQEVKPDDGDVEGDGEDVPRRRAAE